jgi:hypothetical protein
MLLFLSIANTTALAVHILASNANMAKFSVVLGAIHTVKRPFLFTTKEQTTFVIKTFSSS